nr:uncharacterized membrane protein At3g27390 isoform X1 [Ipomoea batatas]
MASQGSRKLKQAIQQYTPVQVWDWLFKSCEVNGIILLHEGLIDAKDIVSYIAGGKCKKLVVKLPSLSILNQQGATKSGHGNGSRCSDGIDDLKDGMQVLRMNLAFREFEVKVKGCKKFRVEMWEREGWVSLVLSLVVGHGGWLRIFSGHSYYRVTSLTVSLKSSNKNSDMGH